ncbi:MAG: flagellar hook-basal body complex protein, partial [Planctomycetota bacterium]
LANIAKNISQGALQATGRTFDLALEGNGFFALAGLQDSVYTRVGTFGLDADANLVDQRTGFMVLDPSNQPIQLDVESLFPPQATANMGFAGNLPAVVEGPLAEVLTSATGLADGNAAQLLGTNAGPFAVPNGQVVSLDIIVDGAPPQTVQLVSTGTITNAAIAAELNNIAGLSATVNGGGLILLETEGTGQSASIKIDPGPAGADLAALSGLSTTLVRGTQTVANDTTELNNLPANNEDYVDGDGIDIVGVDADGSPVNSTFVYGAANDGTTVGDLVTFVEAQYPNATVSLNSSGQIVVEANDPGDVDLLLSIADDAANTGGSDWAIHGLDVTTEGTGPDEVLSSMEVFDTSGTPHTLNFTFQRQGDGSWNVITETPDGQTLSNAITGLRFGEDGSPTGLAGIDTDIIVQFDGLTTPQTVSLDFGLDGGFNGLTQFGSIADVVALEQDGYGVGELATLSVDQDGSIDGFYTNGQQSALGAVGIAVFSNPEGLSDAGNNMLRETANSGRLILASGANGAAGRVIGGNLERSNVDTAEQFVNLIEAQRGYQANARIISAQDDLLQETVNLI